MTLISLRSYFFPVYISLLSLHYTQSRTLSSTEDCSVREYNLCFIRYLIKSFPNLNEVPYPIFYIGTLKFEEITITCSSSWQWARTQSQNLFNLNCI